VIEQLKGFQLPIGYEFKVNAKKKKSIFPYFDLRLKKIGFKVSEAHFQDPQK